MDPLDQLPALLLRANSRLVDGISAGMAARGFDDLRPAHGFAFALLSHGGATAGELAEHLGVSKQAAAQMVAELEDHGYVVRTAHPTDRRAKVVVLTDRGVAATRAAEESATDTLRPWLERVGPGNARTLVRALGDLAAEGPLRPTW